MAVQITLRGFVDIYSAAKKQKLYSSVEVIFDFNVQKASDCSSDHHFKTVLKEAIRAAGSEQFIELLKTDISVRRMIGGTKWVVEPKDDFQIFSSRKTYQETVANGHLDNRDHISRDISFMREMVLETFDHLNADDYFKGFLNNL